MRDRYDNRYIGKMHDLKYGLTDQMLELLFLQECDVYAIYKQYGKTF